MAKNATAKELRFAHIVGEGIGELEFDAALRVVMGAIPTINFKVERIENHRLPAPEGELGEFNPAICDLIREIGVGIKGPIETKEGKGAKSINVSLRQALDLYANVRPVSYYEGVQTRLKDPQRLNTVIFRENTEDVYMGIEAEPGSEKVAKLFELLRNDWGVVLPEHFKTDLVGAGIKLVSRKASFRIMKAAIKYAIAHNRKSICIMHKGNIMKHTEGAFKQWCIDFALANFPEQVYFKEEREKFSPEERSKRIFIDIITADDIFDKILTHPERFDVVVTMNLNGDYVSDAAAGQVGGAPLAASGNIGSDCAIFESIGGTAYDIAGKNIANPSAFLLAFAMMLDHARFIAEAEAIRTSIAELFQEGVGTVDMKFAKALSTTDFTNRVADKVVEKLLTESVVAA